MSYRRHAKTLFGDDDVSRYGYFRPLDRTMVMDIGTGGGTPPAPAGAGVEPLAADATLGQGVIWNCRLET